MGWKPAAVAVILLMLVVVGCSSTGEIAAPPEPSTVDTFEVASTVVSHPSTRSITVWWPVVEGSWPVVFAYHGLSADMHFMSRTASEVAKTGAVVVVPTYRSTQRQYRLPDIECAYRYGRSIAEEYGGDLDRPVTMFGHSLGGSMALGVGLDDVALGPAGDYLDCFVGVQRPDVIVAIGGCYYQYGDETYEFWIPDTTHDDARLTFVAGRDDETCEAWQSRDAARALASAGHIVEYIEADGNHRSLVFMHSGISRDTEFEGMQVVAIIRDAIEAASHD